MECNISSKKPRGSCASRNRDKGNPPNQGLGFLLLGASPTSTWSQTWRALTHTGSWDHGDQSTQESTWVAEATELLGQSTFGPSSSVKRMSSDPDPWTPSLPEESLPPGRVLTPRIRRRSECQISVHLPCKRRACLQRVL